MLRAKCWLLAWFSLTALFGCGGDTSVALCFGDARFCSQAFNPVAKAGPDQTVASGSELLGDGPLSQVKKAVLTAVSTPLHAPARRDEG